MAAALVVSLSLRYMAVFDSSTPRGFALTILTTVCVTTLVWLAATLLTAPEPPEKLEDFYRRVRPPGPGWRRVAREARLTEADAEIAANLLNWALGVAFVYSALFAIDAAVFLEWTQRRALHPLGDRMRRSDVLEPDPHKLGRPRRCAGVKPPGTPRPIT